MRKFAFALLSVTLMAGLSGFSYGQASKKKPTKKPSATANKVVKTTAEPIPSVFPRPIKVADGFQSELSEPSEIVMPLDFSPDRKYPLVIFLPWTGGEASRNHELYAHGFDRLEPFISMITPEAASTQDHSSPGFEAATFRYENRILKDLKVLEERQIVDTNKIILVGFSMGGDMSWALAQRHPGIFRGAIISGSRTSWPEKNSIAQIKSNGAKFYFVMGSDERADRLAGLTSTLGLLDKNQIPYKYERTPGNHVWPTFEQFAAGLEFLLK